MAQVTAESTYDEITEWVDQIALDHLVPLPDLSVSEWAEDHRILTASASAEPGPWSNERTPYLRDIMDALSDESPYENVVFMKGAQIGGTECGLNWLGYTIDRMPAPMMIVWPTENDVKGNVQIRVEPLIDSNPQIKEKIGDTGSNDGADNTMLKEFPGGFLACAMANSTASLRSKPVKKLMLDEVDEYPANAKSQGDPITLAEKRTSTFGPRRKIYKVSTPTVKGASRIERLLATTDFRRYYVPCPFCGVYQVFVWEQMRPENGRPGPVYYECIHCAGEIQNYHKKEMLARGEWRPEQEALDPKSIGFHLSGLYSPHGMLDWSTCMIEYREALGDANKMQAWTNTVLGLPYEEKGERPEWERLYNRRGGHELGTLPDGVLLLTAGADVQKDRIEIEVVGWGRGKESWSVNYYTFYGDPSDLHGDAWNGVRELLSAGFVHQPTGVILQIHSMGIDSGYETNTVYAFAREYTSPKVVVLKGEDSRTQPIGQAGHVDVKLANGKRARRALKRFPVGVSLLKAELYGWLRLDLHEGAAPPPGYCHFPDYGEEYFKQLTAEQLVSTENRRTHLRRSEWRKTRERNEALDCRIYARAAAAILRIDMFKELEWSRLEMSLGATTQVVPAQEASEATERPAGPQARPERRRYRSRGVQ